MTACQTYRAVRIEQESDGWFGIPAPDAIGRLVHGVQGGLLGMPSGRFFAWVIGGALPAALGADWLTSAWGQNAALYACSPAAAVVEEVVGKWLKELLGLPPEASFALATGCQMAHVTALAAARNALLRARGSDVEARGLWGVPPVRVISSDINTGVFDPFESLVAIAKRYGAWVHVNGAFGLWAGASPRYRHLVAGAERADSWATDGHKWLNVPFDCGYAFVRDSAAHRAAMSVSAPYIAGGERSCRHASTIVEGLDRLPGADVLWRPILNQALVRFLDPREEAIEADHDRQTERVMRAVAAVERVLLELAEAA